jgi:hypothetical protein
LLPLIQGWLAIDEQKNRSVIVVVIIVVLVLGVIAYFVAGAQGLAGIINFMKWALIGVVIIGLAVWAAWYLFIRKVRDDRVALNSQRIIEQAKLTKPDLLGELKMSGDIGHPEIRLGHITGYTRIKNILNEEEDVFVFKKAGFPFSLFEEAKAIRVNPDDHSPLIGDVTIMGIAVVGHGGFYYVNHEHLNIERIDRTIKTEVLRQYTMDVLRDVKIISDQAIGINPEHQRMLEGRSLLKIPSRTEPQPMQQQQTYENPRG